MNSHAPEEDCVKQPLVTFAMFAYNQEAYIREAMEGALSQTYEPLEIVFSDDRSSDRTFEIMQEVVASYKGPHLVRLRRSEKNRGLLAHINEAAQEFSGKFIVMAAGDDISHSCRTERLVKAFNSQPKAFAVYSDLVTNKCEMIEPNLSRHLQIVSLYETSVSGGGVSWGASYAYKRECFHWPHPLPEGLYSEDRILPLRAAILGELVALPEKLLFYRTPVSQGRKDCTPEGFSPLLFREHVAAVSEHLNIARREGRIGFFEMYKCKSGVWANFYLTRLTYRRSGRAAKMLARITRGVGRRLLLSKVLILGRKKSGLEDSLI